MAANFQRRYLAILNYFSWAKKFPVLGENQGCGLEISLAKLRSTMYFKTLKNSDLLISISTSKSRDLTPNIFSVPKNIWSNFSATVVLFEIFFDPLHFNIYVPIGNFKTDWH